MVIITLVYPAVCVCFEPPDGKQELSAGITFKAASSNDR